MTIASVFFVVSLVAITILLVIRLSRFENLAVVFLFVAAVSVVYLGNLSLLGLPKPIQNEYFQDGTGRVLYFYFDEDVAIYLLFQTRSDEPPRWYVMPWVESEAARLEELRRGSIGIMAVNLFGSFERSADLQYFHAVPQPRYDPKDAPDTPTIFDRFDQQ